jgi:hypothetical protein
MTSADYYNYLQTLDMIEQETTTWTDAYMRICFPWDSAKHGSMLDAGFDDASTAKGLWIEGHHKIDDIEYMNIWVKDTIEPSSTRECTLKWSRILPTTEETWDVRDSDFLSTSAIWDWTESGVLTRKCGNKGGLDIVVAPEGSCLAKSKNSISVTASDKVYIYFTPRLLEDNLPSLLDFSIGIDISGNTVCFERKCAITESTTTLLDSGIQTVEKTLDVKNYLKSYSTETQIDSDFSSLNQFPMDDYLLVIDRPNSLLYLYRVLTSNIKEEIDHISLSGISGTVSAKVFFKFNHTGAVTHGILRGILKSIVASNLHSTGGLAFPNITFMSEVETMPKLRTVLPMTDWLTCYKAIGAINTSPGAIDKNGSGGEAQTYFAFNYLGGELEPESHGPPGPFTNLENATLYLYLSNAESSSINLYVGSMISDYSGWGVDHDEAFHDYGANLTKELKESWETFLAIYIPATITLTAGQHGWVAVDVTDIVGGFSVAHGAWSDPYSEHKFRMGIYETDNHVAGVEVRAEDKRPYLILQFKATDALIGKPEFSKLNLATSLSPMRATLSRASPALGLKVNTIDLTNVHDQTQFDNLVLDYQGKQEGRLEGSVTIELDLDLNPGETIRLDFPTENIVNKDFIIKSVTHNLEELTTQISVCEVKPRIEDIIATQ